MADCSNTGCRQPSPRLALALVHLNNPKRWMLHFLKKRFPIATRLQNYKLNFLLYDLAGGLIVGFTAIPQSLAFAQLANLPLQTGLYTTMISSFIYSIFGTAKDVNLGATSLMSLLVGTVIDDVGALVHQLLAFFCGIILIAFAFLKIEVFMCLFPTSVTTGFTSAAATLIIAHQLKNMFGVSNLPRDFFKLLLQLVRRFRDVNLFDFTAGTLTLAFLISVQYLVPKLTCRVGAQKKLKGVRKFACAALTAFVTLRAVFVIVVSTSIAFAVARVNYSDNNNDTNLSTANFTRLQQLSGLTLVGPVPRGLPKPEFPPFSRVAVTGGNQLTNSTLGFRTVMSRIQLGVFVVPLISAIEHLAVARSFSQRNDYTIDASQEIFASGLANLVGAFFNAYSSSASLSRSALNSQCRVKTPLCGLFTAGLILLALVTVADKALLFVPKATLAAVVISAALSLFDSKTVKQIWLVNRLDIIPTAVTFFACLLLDIEQGVLIGITSGLVMSSIQGTALSKKKLSVHETTLAPSQLRCLVVTLPPGNLRFESADCIKKLWSKSSNFDGPVLVDCSRTIHCDFAVVMAVFHLAKCSPTMKKKTSYSSSPICLAGLDFALQKTFEKAVAGLKIGPPKFRKITFQPTMFAAIWAVENNNSSDAEVKVSESFIGGEILPFYPSGSDGVCSERRRSF